MATQVSDCFLFSDELDLLDTRLRLLAPVVDRFVIVEAARTFTGQPKPLTYEANKARFDRYHDKIVHLVANLDIPATNAWDRENAQRTRLRDHVAEYDDDHLFLMGDVDEFPYPAAVEALRHGCTTPTRLGMRHSIYFANWELPDEFEIGTMAFRPSQVEHLGVRSLLGDRHDEWEGYVEDYLVDGGRHVSFLGGADAVRRKLAAYSHEELNSDRYHGRGHLEEALRRGVHLDGVWELRRIPRDEFDVVIEAIAHDHPELVNEEASPARLRRDAYRLITRLRVKGRARALTRVLQGRPWLVDLMSPGLGVAQRLIDTRRRSAERARGPHGHQRRVSVSDLERAAPQR